MNHFNFFEIMQKDNKGVNPFVICAILAACVILALGGIYGYSQLKFLTAQSQMDYLNSVERDVRFIQQNAQQAKLNTEISKAEEDYVFARSAELIVESASTVEQDILEKVFSYFDEDAKIIKMQVSGREITINAIARSLKIVGEMYNELNNDESFSYVYVNTASNDSHTEDNGEDAVVFSCRLTVSDVGMYGPEDNGGEEQ